jgi:preprotein translocase subunit SecE
VAREADLGRGGALRPDIRPAGDVREGGRGNILKRTWRFSNESVAELKKVEWPGQNQVIQGTVVVLVACAIVGLYLWLNDQVWKQFVEKILLGQ